MDCKAAAKTDMNKVYAYLFDLQESGVTNTPQARFHLLFGAVPYIMCQFPDLSQSEAREALFYWMDNYEKLKVELRMQNM